MKRFASVNYHLLAVFILMVIFSCEKKNPAPQQSIVAVHYENGRAVLFRHGQPYFIKGAAGTEHMDKVALYGGNSIRTWSLYKADSILDQAEKLGLTVTLGIEIGRPHWGNDFNYWDIWAVDEKIEELRPFIEKYKNHPALLMWGVGNEVKEYGGSKRFLVYFILNRIAGMIKEVDPNHPTMTAIDAPSESHFLGIYKHLLPNIDIMGFNSFKKINGLYDKIYGKNGWGRAYILSEWGSYGHWEVTETEWGAPKELKNSEKRELMQSHWNTAQKDSVFFLGGYAFYWGFKHEATHTWFSMFTASGEETSSVKFLQYAWSGKKASNIAPEVQEMYIEANDGPRNDNVYLTNAQQYSAVVIAEDLDGDRLNYKWEIRQEENYFLNKATTSYPMEYLLTSQEGTKVTFTTPKDEGAFRIFVFVFDGNGNVSSYNIPFYVVTK